MLRLLHVCVHMCSSQLQAAKAAVDLAQHQAKIEAAEAALKDHAQVRLLGLPSAGAVGSCAELCVGCMHAAQAGAPVSATSLSSMGLAKYEMLCCVGCR